MSTPELESFADWGCSQIRPGLESPLSPSLCSISISVLSPGALDLKHKKGDAASTHPSAPHTVYLICVQFLGSLCTLPLTTAPTPGSHDSLSLALSSPTYSINLALCL